MPTINTTVSTASTTKTNKEYYEKKLLTRAETKLVYGLFGQKRSIPRNGGKTIEFRRWDLFTDDVESLLLTEGVTPDGKNITQTSVESTVKQYGMFIEISDLLELSMFDPIQRDAGDLLGDRLGIAADHVTRNAMVADASAYYVASRTSMLGITSSDKLTITEVRKVVRTLRKAKAMPFSDSRGDYFVCVVDPDTEYDLMNDSLWLDPAKYKDTEKIYKGEIGLMYGVLFVRSTEVLVSTQAVNNLVNAAVTSGSSLVLKNEPTAEAIKYLSTPGNKIKIGATEYTLAASTPYVASTKTVTVTATFTAGAGLAENDVVYSEDAGACEGAGKVGVPVHHSLIFGQEAYGTIDISGEGAIKIITHPVGHGDDPLEQRGTIAGKITAFTAKVLNPLWIVDIMHAVTA